MFCPGCGLEERHSNQFCRACGTDLRLVRSTIERTDNITASAISARDEIGRAIALKIKEAESAVELKIVAEDVLPQIEKFLESPEEKRLRRVRTGTIISLVGLGATIAFTAASAIMTDPGIIVIAAMGLTTFFIGLSFVINGLLFTLPKKSLPDDSSAADRQRALDTANSSLTNELNPPSASRELASVTEHTTRHLKENQTLPRL